MLWKPYLLRIKTKLDCIKPGAQIYWQFSSTSSCLTLKSSPCSSPPIAQGRELFRTNIISKKTMLCKIHFQRAFEDPRPDKWFAGLAKQALEAISQLCHAKENVKDLLTEQVLVKVKCKTYGKYSRSFHKFKNHEFCLFFSFFCFFPLKP